MGLVMCVCGLGKSVVVILNRWSRYASASRQQMIEPGSTLGRRVQEARSYGIEWGEGPKSLEAGRSLV